MTSGSSSPLLSSPLISSPLFFSPPMMTCLRFKEHNMCQCNKCVQIVNGESRGTDLTWPCHTLLLTRRDTTSQPSRWKTEGRREKRTLILLLGKIKTKWPVKFLFFFNLSVSVDENITAPFHRRKPCAQSEAKAYIKIKNAKFLYPPALLQLSAYLLFLDRWTQLH